jgi:hypothetical protein
MTNAEIVEKAVEMLRKTDKVIFKVIDIKPWGSDGGIELNIIYLGRNNDHRKQNFGFNGAWFDLNDNPLDLNDKCGMDKVKDEDTKLILRIMYYLYAVWYLDEIK